MYCRRWHVRQVYCCFCFAVTKESFLTKVYCSYSQKLFYYVFFPLASGSIYTLNFSSEVSAAAFSFHSNKEDRKH